MKALYSCFTPSFEDSYAIKELGIKLSPEQRTKLKIKLQALEARAPALSSIRLTFYNVNGKIKASLTVLSLAKNFRASGVGADPLELYDELATSVKKQIASWKQTRFINRMVVQTKESFKDKSKEALSYE